MRRSLAEFEEAFRRGVNPLAYIPYAEELRRRRDPQRAADICHEGLQKHGPSCRGWTVLAQALFDLHRPTEAMDALTRALEVGPGSYEASMLLARALTQRGNYAEAREVLAPLQATYANDPVVQQLSRMHDAELRHSKADREQVAREEAEEAAPQDTPSLREEIEEVEGVDGIFEFGVREVRGDLLFEDDESDVMDDDLRRTITECWRLSTKLNFGRPNHIQFEAPSGKMLLRIEGGLGVMAITSANAKAGKLRYMLDQYVRALSR